MKSETDPPEADRIDPDETEQRTSRMELKWPPSVRTRVIDVALKHDVSINEVVLQCIELGLGNPVVHRLLDEAAKRRRPNRRYARGKEGVDRAA
jgi:hypothetical protein